MTLHHSASDHSRFRVSIVLLALVAIIAAFGCLLCGSVDIPASEVLKSTLGQEASRHSWTVIVVETRIPMVLTAAMAGAMLATAGLMLQTCFNNPLAGPSILGISTGASLGVAIVVMAFGGIALAGMGQYLSSLVGAIAGAAAVMALLVVLSRIVSSTTMLLIAGILIGYFASSAISLLNYYSSEQSVYTFALWGLGTFGGGSLQRAVWFFITGLLLVGVSMLFIKPLNAFLLGERYAASMGINIRFTRHALLAVTALLTAAVTAFCGPIGFIGLIVPHISRMMLNSSNHSLLMPATALCGAATALLCAWLSVALGGAGVIPINAITPIIGVPVVLYVMLNRKRLLYFD